MIKGVTKNVIELNNMESEFFERAIIILKDSCTIKDEILRKEAKLMFENNVPNFIRLRKKTYHLKMFASAVTGAILAGAVSAAFYLFV